MLLGHRFLASIPVCILAFCLLPHSVGAVAIEGATLDGNTQVSNGALVEPTSGTLGTDTTAPLIQGGGGASTKEGECWYVTTDDGKKKKVCSCPSASWSSPGGGSGSCAKTDGECINTSGGGSCPSSVIQTLQSVIDSGGSVSVTDGQGNAQTVTKTTPSADYASLFGSFQSLIDPIAQWSSGILQSKLGIVGIDSTIGAGVTHTPAPADLWNLNGNVVKTVEAGVASQPTLSGQGVAQSGFSVGGKVVVSQSGFTSTINDDKYANGYTPGATTQSLGTSGTSLLGGLGGLISTGLNTLQNGASQLFGTALGTSNAAPLQQGSQNSGDVVGNVAPTDYTSVNDYALGGVDSTVVPTLVNGTDQTQTITVQRAANLMDQMKALAAQRPDLGITPQTIQVMEDQMQKLGYTPEQVAQMTLTQAQVLANKNKGGVDFSKVIDQNKMINALGGLFPNGLAGGLNPKIQTLKDLNDNKQTTIGQLMSTFATELGISVPKTVSTQKTVVTPGADGIVPSGAVTDALKQIPLETNVGGVDTSGLYLLTYPTGASSQKSNSSYELSSGNATVIQKSQNTSAEDAACSGWLCQTVLAPFGGVDGARAIMQNLLPQQSSTALFPVVGEGLSTTPHGYFGASRGASGRIHAGYDILAPVGTPVVAIMDGKVVRADDNDKNGYGLTIDIQYPDGTVQRMAHLSKIEVAVGQTVTPGQEVGKSGQTGNAAGDPPSSAHVHYEVIKADAYASGQAKSVYDEKTLEAGRIDPAAYFTHLEQSNPTPSPVAANGVSVQSALNLFNTVFPPPTPTATTGTGNTGTTGTVGNTGSANPQTTTGQTTVSPTNILNGVVNSILGGGGGGGGGSSSAQGAQPNTSSQCASSNSIGNQVVGWVGNIFGTILGGLAGGSVDGSGIISGFGNILGSALSSATSGGGTNCQQGTGATTNTTPQDPDVSCSPTSIPKNQPATVTLTWVCYGSTSADGIGFPLQHMAPAANAVIHVDATTTPWLMYGISCSNGTTRACVVPVVQ